MGCDRGQLWAGVRGGGDWCDIRVEKLIETACLLLLVTIDTACPTRLIGREHIWPRIDAIDVQLPSNCRRISSQTIAHAYKRRRGKRRKNLVFLASIFNSSSSSSSLQREITVY